MKCYKVQCPNCDMDTIVPELHEAFYDIECFGFVGGEFYCIQCGKPLIVSCTVKIDEIQAFKVAGSSSEQRPLLTEESSNAIL